MLDLENEPTTTHRITLETIPRDTLYFVCSGNTCRSPMAERLMRHALDAEDPPLQELRTDSFGTAAFGGTSASENAVFVMKKVGLELDSHSSKSADHVDLDRAIAFFCMTESHRRTLLSYYGVPEERVFLMREWNRDSMMEIPDPYGDDVRAYAACRDAMVESIPHILTFLKSEKPS